MSQQNTNCAIQQSGVLAGSGFKSNLIAHRIPQTLAALLCHPLGYTGCRNPSRLSADHPSAIRTLTNSLHQELGELSGLAAAGSAAYDDDVCGGKSVEDLLLPLVPWQPLSRLNQLLILGGIWCGEDLGSTLFEQMIRILPRECHLQGLHVKASHRLRNLLQSMLRRLYSLLQQQKSTIPQLHRLRKLTESSAAQPLAPLLGAYGRPWLSRFG
mmetsp:Transcript_40848/g.98087  ORF Transcript_40848/g.98087 Transcript_40848/m.98087 type:complete len:213 (-) Transcript_40848:439-1077(-)